MTGPLVLASGSMARRALLAGSGVPFDILPADIDERFLIGQLEDRETPSADIAQALADQKALTVSAKRPDALVLGGDQVLSLQGSIFSKPRTPDEARDRLSLLRGRTHHLHNGLSLAQGGEVVWRYREVAALTMRDFSDDFLDDFIARHGEAVLTSVGAYRLEDEGIQLFERIEGDYFAILGLPLLPLLSELRSHGVVPT